MRNLDCLHKFKRNEQFERIEILLGIRIDQLLPNCLKNVPTLDIVVSLDISSKEDKNFLKIFLKKFLICLKLTFIDSIKII